MDAKQFTGSDDRDSLSPAPDAPATIAPTCRGCGFVVYAVGVRLPYGGVLCRRCAEQAEREPEPSETFCSLIEQQQLAMRVKR